MKKLLLILVVGLFLVGCAAENITEQNPFGITDPNQVQQWINVGIAAGQAMQATGTAAGNPGAGIIGTAIVGIAGLAALVIKDAKKKG